MASSDPLIRNNVTVAGNQSSTRTIIFLHGFGADQSVWQAVARPFLDSFRVVLLDNVGSANTLPEDFVEHRYLNLERYADDLVEVAEALDLKGAVVVGHSVGGMISLLASIRAPERFSRIATICTSPRYRNDEGYWGGLTYRDINTIYELVMRNYSDWTRTFAIAAMATPGKPELVTQFVESLRKIPQERTLTVLCSILQSDYRDILGQVTHPTLIIQPRRDSIVPLEVAEYLHRKIKRSALLIIDAAGHFPHLSTPAQIVAAIRSFLD